jgi:methylthioxylose transferase
MRGRERADIVVWLTMLVFAVVGLALLPRPGSLSPDALGLYADHPGAPWLLTGAAVTAAVTLGLRGWMARCWWPVLQLGCAALTTVWTATLVGTRHNTFDGTEVGTFLGNGLSAWVRSVQAVVPWSPAIIIGLGAGIAGVLLNAAVQSLSGATQARRLAPLGVISPAAALIVDGALVLSLLAVSGVLALSAMASERGRGLWWSTGLGLLSGVLLVASGFAGFAGTAAGVGMLCIYFLRRRSLMIIVAGLGTLASLLLAAGILGWSWPDQFGAASALRLARPESLAAGIVAAVVLVLAIGGPALRESLRKVRGTPAWPILLTGVVAGLLAVLTRPVDLGILPAAAVWLPLLNVAASAPPHAGGVPDGPNPVGMVLTAACGVALAAAGLILA